MGRRVRLISLDQLDGRTRAVAKTRQLLNELQSDMGGAEYISAAQRQLAQRASVLGALIENIEANWAEGKPIEVLHYLRAVGVQRRVLQTLGLERRARSVNEISPLEYLSKAADIDAAAEPEPDDDERDDE